MDTGSSENNPKTVAVAAGDDSTKQKKRAKRGSTKFTRRKKYKTQDISPTDDVMVEGDFTEESTDDLASTAGGHSHSTDYREVNQDLADPFEPTFTSNVDEEVEREIIASLNEEDNPIIHPSGEAEVTQVRAVDEVEASLVEDIVSELRKMLPNPWIPIPDKNGIHVVMISRCEEKAIQRRAFFSFCGSRNLLTVHRKPLLDIIFNNIFKDIQCVQIESEEGMTNFVELVLKVVNRFRSYDICKGVFESEFRCFWDSVQTGEIDRNPYGEIRYDETFRAFDCHLLVPTQPIIKQRCQVCVSVKNRFRERLKNRSDTPSPHTPNVHLSREQLLTKLRKKQQDLEYARAQIVKLKAEVQRTIERDGVPIDEELSKHLCSAISEEKLTPVQKLFLQEQLKAVNAKSASGRRWHPTLLRFALLLKSTSSSAYQAVKESGLITLPSERTLFEYSHAIVPQEGCSTEKLNRLCKLITEKCKESYQDYHVLLMDEMHLNKKLVYQKSSGEMVGYVNLTDVEKEIRDFECHVKGGKESEPPIASNMLAFMVKGVASGISEVVAAYPTSGGLDAEQLYDKAWEVIGALERSGIKVIGIVGDGASVNRAFFALHPPLTKGYQVTFDTVNLCDPSRPIFFFSDPPHLLKTIRNCFFKSGTARNCTRLLTKGKEVIVWDTIKRLYNEDKSLNLRRCYKLNSYNVFLNAYSVMKVNYAAQVMSNTVAMDLQSRNWPGTSETVKFIKETNDFFDRLNGYSSNAGKRTANRNLDPYTDVDDERFDKLLEFLNYLKEWKAEVESKQGFSASEKGKMMLSQQTLDGIEISIRAFIGGTRFLLQTAGVKFVNARVFCQDPLERYFGKQRQSGGGNRNPTVAQFLSNEVKIAVHRDVNVKRGNVSGDTRGMEVSAEPLPKRRRLAE